MDDKNKDIKNLSGRIIGSEVWHVAVITIIAIIVHVQMLSFGLVYCDDHEIILKNSIVKQIDPVKAFSSGYMATNYYRPLVNLSFMVDYAIGQEHPLIYHLSNLIIHILFCISLYYLFRNLHVPAVKGFAAALIFAVHPLTAGSVSWIVGRNDIIYGLFCLLSFIMLIKYMESRKSGYNIMHLLFLLAAFLSKETALAFPAVMAIYLLLKYKDESRLFAIKRVFFWWLPVYGLYFWLRSAAVLGHNVNNMGWDIFLRNLRVFPEYIAKTIVPLWLSVLPTYNSVNTAAGIILMFLIAFAVVFFFKYSDKTGLATGMAWFILLILPNCFFSLKNANDWNDYLESRMYLPLAGLIIFFFSMNLKRILILKPARIRTTIAVALVLLSFQTVIVSRHYRNDESFYLNAVGQSPSMPLAHYILAKIYENRNNPQLAEEHLIKAIALRSGDYGFNYRAGEFYFNNRNFDKALIYLTKAGSLKPGNRKILLYMAQASFFVARYRESIDICNKLLSKWPGMSSVYYYLAGSYLFTGDYDKSDYYSDLIKSGGLSTAAISMDYYRTAGRLYREKDYKNSLRLLYKSTELDSGNTEAAKTLKSLKVL